MQIPQYSWALMWFLLGLWRRFDQFGDCSHIVHCHDLQCRVCIRVSECEPYVPCVAMCFVDKRLYRWMLTVHLFHGSSAGFGALA